LFTKFLNIDREKQQRVVNAALKEFANKGYDTASTNTMCREAGISKGLLFHYFTSKKDLYLYLYDYSVKQLSVKIHERVNVEERDFFERLKQISEVKFAILNTSPDLFAFLQTANLEESLEVGALLAERRRQAAESEYNKLFDGIDVAKFKDGLDVKRTMNVILWTMEGLGEAERRRHKALGIDLRRAEIMDEFEQYVQLFKSSFYKQP